MNAMKTFYVTALCGLLFYSCSTEEATQEAIRPVKTMEVSSIYDYQMKDFPAITQETQESQMSFRVAGPLIKLPVDEGQRVRRGQLLAKIDPRDFEVDLIAREAKYEQTKATKERFDILYEKDAVSKNELDLRVANFLQAKSNYENAKNALSDINLFAPFSGFVDKKFVENFEEVRAGQTIVTMVDISVIEIRFYIAENIAVQFRKFASASVKFEVYPDIEFNATLKEIGKKAESEGFPVTLYLDHNNVKEAEYVFGPGMSCFVNLQLGDKPDKEEVGMVYVPFHSLFSEGVDSKPSVWVVDENVMSVSKRQVSVTQMMRQDFVQVVSGLNSGEIIVTAGVSQLREGQKVKFVDERL